MNCDEWIKCMLAPYVPCPYCKLLPCDKIGEEE